MRIDEAENGPLIAKNVTRMTGPDGAEMDVKPVMALCRCGHSGNKPFCDGTHAKVGFESRGGQPAGDDTVLTYSGDGVTLAYNPRICSHAAYCVTEGAGIFDSDRKPWVQINAGDAEKLRDVVRKCPSGALRLAEGEGADSASATNLIPDRAEVTIQKNGPYMVLDAEIDADVAGAGGTKAKAVLCRCGHSGNKPWCDGSHRAAGWTDDS